MRKLNAILILLLGMPLALAQERKGKTAVPTSPEDFLKACSPLRATYQNRHDEIARKNVAGAEGAQAHYQLAIWCETNQFFGLAEQEYRAAIEKQPDHAEARRKLWFAKNFQTKEWVVERGRLEVLRQKYIVPLKNIKFPDTKTRKSYEEKGEDYKKVMAILYDPLLWVAAFNSVDTYTGLFRASQPIEVTFKDKFSKEDGLSGVLARGGGTRAKGQMEFYIEELVATLKHREKPVTRPDFAALGVHSVVATTIVHEMVHVYQFDTNYTINDSPPPLVVVEGLAEFAASNFYNLLPFRPAAPTMPNVTDNINFAAVYPRGFLFFQFIEENYGRAAVHQISAKIFRQKHTLPDAVTAVIKKPWNEITTQEKCWSAAWLANLPE